MKREGASPSAAVHSFDCYLAHYLPHQKSSLSAALSHRPDTPALDELWSAEELHHAMCSVEALATQGHWQLGINPDKRAEFDFLLLPCFD